MPNTHAYVNVFSFNHPTELAPVGVVAGTGPAGPLHVAVARATLRPNRTTLGHALMDLRQQGAIPLVLAIPYAKPQPGVTMCLMGRRKTTTVVLEVSTEEAERTCTSALPEPFRRLALQLLGEAIRKPE